MTHICSIYILCANARHMVENKSDSRGKPSLTLCLEGEQELNKYLWTHILVMTIRQERVNETYM